MRSETATVEGPRGCTLLERRWLPDGEPTGVVVVVHGLGEHLARYDRVAAALVGRGLAVVGVDHLGHGRSGGRRGDARTIDDLVGPVEDVRTRAVERWSGRPQVVLGHSMGGLLAAHHLLDHQAGLAGAVLSAPAVVPGPSVTPLTIALGRVAARVWPTLGVLSLDVDALSRDPAVVRAYRDDPLVHHGRTSARLGLILLGAARRVLDEARAITLPLLLVQGGADRLTDPAGVRTLRERVGSSDVTTVMVEDAFHEVFNEPGGERTIARVAAWIDDRVGALRSRRHDAAPTP